MHLTDGAWGRSPTTYHASATAAAFRAAGKYLILGMKGSGKTTLLEHLKVCSTAPLPVFRQAFVLVHTAFSPS